MREMMTPGAPWDEVLSEHYRLMSAAAGPRTPRGPLPASPPRPAPPDRPRSPPGGLRDPPRRLTGAGTRLSRAPPGGARRGARTPPGCCRAGPRRGCSFPPAQGQGYSHVSTPRARNQFMSPSWDRRPAGEPGAGTGSGTEAIDPIIEAGRGRRDAEGRAEDLARLERESVVSRHHLGPAARQERADEGDRRRNREPGRRVARAGPVELGPEARAGVGRRVAVADRRRVDRRPAGRAARGGTRPLSARRATCGRSPCRRPRRAGRDRAGTMPGACAPSTSVSTPRSLSPATRRSTGKTSAVGLVTWSSRARRVRGVTASSTGATTSSSPASGEGDGRRRRRGPRSSRRRTPSPSGRRGRRGTW